jgi:hypothetical protein
MKNKIELARRILQSKVATRSSGAEFLNEVFSYLHGNSKPDFHVFNAESWTRAWRRALETDPSLDDRG